MQHPYSQGCSTIWILISSNQHGCSKVPFPWLDRRLHFGPFHLIKYSNVGNFHSIMECVKDSITRFLIDVVLLKVKNCFDEWADSMSNRIRGAKDLLKLGKFRYLDSYMPADRCTPRWSLPIWDIFCTVQNFFVCQILCLQNTNYIRLLMLS